MTDLTPNDLSHLTDEEFNALCPQGEHAPGVAPLSPAVSAVWEAFNQDEAGVFVDYGDKLAAALRAAADQLHCAGSPEAGDWILAIAAELDGGAR
jgi:hypothetical protein